MKKILSILLVLLIFSVAVFPVFALNPASGSTTVSTTVDETYSISIPASTPIVFNALSTELVIALSTAKLEPGHSVTFSAAGSGTLKNAADASKTIPYTINKAGSPFTSTSFSAVGSQTLTVDITQSAWDAAVAGSYSDTITFTITYS